MRWAHLWYAKVDYAARIDPEWRMAWQILNHGGISRDLSKIDLSDADLSRADFSGVIGVEST